jgi:hypothetical protein
MTPGFFPLNAENGFFAIYVVKCIEEAACDSVKHTGSRTDKKENKIFLIYI